MKLRVGVIGLGEHWESRYRPALRALRDRFEVRAVYCPVQLLAEKAAKRMQAAAVGGFRELARRHDVDAVLLLGSDWLGSLPLRAACDADKAIFCGADWEIDLEQIQRLRQRVDQSGVAFVAAFARRYTPATLRLKELIATRLGSPRLIFSHLRSRQPRTNSSSPRVDRSDRDARKLTELVDWCCYVAGREPTSVLGVEHRAARDSAAHDYRMLTLDFSHAAGDGPLAQISCGSYISARWPEAISFRPPAQLQVCCERGIAFVDLPATLIWFDEAGRHQESLENERPVGEQLLMRFHRAVTSLIRKRDDLEDTYRAIRVVLAAGQSAREGRRIELAGRDESRSAASA